MRDTKKILRHAIFNALDGQITYNSVAVPVVDEKIRNSAPSDLFIVLSTQSESPVERNSSSFNTLSSIDIDIVQKTGTEVSKDGIDDVYEDMLEIIFPSISTLGLTVPSGFQFQEGFRESASTFLVQDTPTQSVLVSRVRLTFIIVQQ